MSPKTTELPLAMSELEKMKAEIARLTQENNKLSAVSESKLSIRVSAKGAISVYGLGRWPVTLYRSQMERFLSIAPQIADFIVANRSKLAEKPDVAAAVK